MLSFQVLIACMGGGFVGYENERRSQERNGTSAPRFRGFAIARQHEPRETWRRTVKKERTRLGFGTWREAETAAKDRAMWRRRINGLFSTRRERTTIVLE